VRNVSGFTFCRTAACFIFFAITPYVKRETVFYVFPVPVSIATFLLLMLDPKLRRRKIPVSRIFTTHADGAEDISSSPSRLHLCSHLLRFNLM
jgi:hypothetical protein